MKAPRGWRRIYDDGNTVVFGRRDAEPAGGLMSREVKEVEYVHVEDGPATIRFHPFKPGVSMVALPGNKSVLLTGTHPIWDDL